MTKLDPAERAYIEAKLFRLLTSPEVIEERWQSDWGVLQYWTDSATLLVMWRLLKDSTVVYTNREIYNSWFADEAPDLIARFRLLGPVTRVMAKHWLREREWNVNDAYPWVEHYVVKVRLPDV